MRKTGKSRFGGGDQELSFGHVKFMMPIRHANKCSVGILIMNTVLFFKNEIIILKQRVFTVLKICYIC